MATCPLKELVVQSNLMIVILIVIDVSLSAAEGT